VDELNLVHSWVINHIDFQYLDFEDLLNKDEALRHKMTSSIKAMSLKYRALWWSSLPMTLFGLIMLYHCARHRFFMRNNKQIIGFVSYTERDIDSIVRIELMFDFDVCETNDKKYEKMSDAPLELLKTYQVVQWNVEQSDSNKSKFDDLIAKHGGASRRMKGFGKSSMIEYELRSDNKKAWIETPQKTINDILYDFVKWIKNVESLFKQSFEDLQIFKEIVSEDTRDEISEAFEKFKKLFKDKLSYEGNHILLEIKEYSTYQDECLDIETARSNAETTIVIVHSLQNMFNKVFIKARKAATLVNECIDVVNEVHKKYDITILDIPKIQWID
jgi:hypothetical protein